MRPVYALVAGMASLMIVMGIGRIAYTPILPFMQHDVHLSEKMAGYLASSNYLGYLFGALVASFYS
ncbi:YbfB/YjiJ family MFS transporter [Virgibacillus salarius]|uniref:YbfB/YjiJ family MFS transporter n=1 Tax=Virgibacillus salarius TaxID=447199 RepID=UPI000418AF1B|nr:YbfB/YjiJ family MFS transporter [Virgibacillus salarius]